MTDAAECRERIAVRLEAAGLSAERFIDVNDGKKASVDHTQRSPDAVRGNYGIYANADDGLVILDVDDYDELEDRSGLEALVDLPPTLEQESPHGGTHRFYAVERDDAGREIAEVFKDELDVKNPNPTWGEVRVANQYVVGAGSQLDGCDKDGCEECAIESGGRYELGADREIATVTPNELLGVLRADPNLGEDEHQESAEAFGEGSHEAAERPKSTEADPEDVLSYALTESEHDTLQRLWRGDYSDYDGDRSEAECALAYHLAFWIGHGRSTAETKRLVRDALNGKLSIDDVSGPRLQKWPDRTDDSYRESVLDAVSEQTEFFEPSSNSDPAHSAARSASSFATTNAVPRQKYATAISRGGRSKRRSGSNFIYISLNINRSLS